MLTKNLVNKFYS